MELDDQIKLLEDGGKSEGRGLRIVSYSSELTAKSARAAIIEQLHRLDDILKDDYLGEDQ